MSTATFRLTGTTDQQSVVDYAEGSAKRNVTTAISQQNITSDYRCLYPVTRLILMK